MYVPHKGSARIIYIFLVLVHFCFYVCTTPTLLGLYIFGTPEYTLVFTRTTFFFNTPYIYLVPGIIYFLILRQMGKKIKFKPPIYLDILFYHVQHTYTPTHPPRLSSHSGQALSWASRTPSRTPACTRSCSPHPPTPCPRLPPSWTRPPWRRTFGDLGTALPGRPAPRRSCPR